MIAIIPAAGKGTRMAEYPGPKELLPLGGRSVLQWVLDEAAEAQVDDTVVILSPRKPPFAVGNARRVFQEKAEGLAPAVALGWDHGPALVLLPDTVFFPASPTRRLKSALESGADIAIPVELVEQERVGSYGIVEWDMDSGRITKIVEKPQPGQTSSRWAISARFGLSQSALTHVRQRVQEQSGNDAELDLTPILNSAIVLGCLGVALPLAPDQRRLDCGSPKGYRQACEVVDGRI